MKIQLFYTHRIAPSVRKWSGGTTANEQISWNFHRRATERGYQCSVHYFGDGHIKPNKNDICICHPGPALMQLANAGYKVHMICPWSAWPANLKSGGQHLWIKPQFDAVSKIFGLGGQIWNQKANEPENPYYRWRNKLHVINMGVDTSKFQNWKNFKFNPPGKRGFLFMGSPTWWKGINEMKKVLEDKPYHLWMCGDGPRKDLAPNIHYMGHIDNNGSELKGLIQKKIDFYLHMSYFDAQATTIMENVAHGLVPVCTPESGFGQAIMLNHVKDIDGNRDILDNMQQLSNDELIKKSKECIKVVQEEHNWNKIIDNILNQL